MRIALLLLFQAFTIHVVFAQDVSLKTSFGARLGLAVSHPNFQKGSPPSDFETSWGTGIATGVYLNVPLSSKLAFQPEYLYRQLNSSISDPKTDLTFSYLSLPVLFQYRITEKLSLMAGPQFELLIESQRDNEDATHGTETRSISILGGLEYRIWKSLSIDCRYVHGLNHISYEVQVDQSYEFKFEGIQISAGWEF